MRSILRRTVPAVLLCLMLAVCAALAEGPGEDGFSWTLEDGVLTVTGTGDMADYQQGRAPWYSRRGEITSAVFSGGVTHIGDNCCQGFAALTKVTLPSTLKSIGESAFYDSGLKAVEIPAGASVGGSAFSYCSSLESVILGEKVSLGGRAFAGCGKLASAALPKEGSLGEDAFKNCTSLKAVTVAAKLTVGASAFEGCSALETAELSEGCSLGDKAFSGCGVRTLTVPKGASLGAWAFSGCAVEELTLCDGATFGQYAFAYCESLKTVTLPVDSAYVEAQHVFYGSGAEEVRYTAGTTGAGADREYSRDTLEYNGRRTIKKAVFEEGVTKIGDCTMYGCGALEEASLPSTLKSIGESAFYDSGLKAVEIPAGAAVGGSAFAYCSSLESVVLGEKVSLGGRAFVGCGKLASAALPKEGSLGEEAFKNCTSLKAVTVAAKLTVGDSAFEGCSSLETAELSEGCSLGDKAFSGCGVRTLTVPKDASLGAWAFSGCAVEELTLCDGATFGQYAFAHCESLKTVTLPVDSAYVEAQHVFYGSGAEEVRYTAGTTGAGADREYSRDTLEYNGRHTIKKAVFEEGVTKIGDCTMYGCEALEEASLPSTLKSIGESAFYDSGLKAVEIPAGAAVGGSAFAYCPALESVVLGEKVSLGGQAFVGCGALGRLKVRADVRLEGDAFGNCGSISELDLASRTVFDLNAATGSAQWESSNTGAARVSGTGEVTADRAGTALLTDSGGRLITLRVFADPAVGDVSGDGYVDSADAMLILRRSAGLCEFSEKQLSMGDVDGDGEVSSMDALMILKYDAGLITGLGQ